MLITYWLNQKDGQQFFRVRRWVEAGGGGWRRAEVDRDGQRQTEVSGCGQRWAVGAQTAVYMFKVKVKPTRLSILLYSLITVKEPVR